MAEALRRRVTSDTKAAHKSNVRSVQSGNGYRQRQSRSLRLKLRSWDIKVMGQKALIGEVKAFFDARDDIEPFSWQPPRGGTALVEVSKYTETSKGGKAYELDRTFEEVLA